MTVRGPPRRQPAGERQLLGAVGKVEIEPHLTRGDLGRPQSAITSTGKASRSLVAGLRRATGSVSIMNATATIAPTRTRPTGPQHMRALERANKVRLARAELKRQVATGQIDAAEVLLACPWEAENMAVADLLVSQRRWGQTRCRKFLAQLQNLGEEDDRFDDRPPAPDARGYARRLDQRGANLRDAGDPDHAGAWPLGNGHPDESLTCHQPASIPISPSRGRTCQTPQPRSPRSRTGSRTNL